MAKKKQSVKSDRIVDIEGKLKALNMAKDIIEKEYGNGSVMRLGDEPAKDIEVVHTGSLGLDIALGVGGFPRGRITEIYGPESSGKTTLAIHAIAEAQKQGGVAALIDAEHAFDRFYAQALGVDTNNLWIAQPDYGEQALEIAEKLINSGAIDILVIDSVAALIPKAELDGDMGDKNVGLHARLMSQAMRKLTGAISRTRTVCIFINQLRDKIGIMWGSPETTTGGNALKFYASVRVDIRPNGYLKKSDDPYGRTVKVKIVKNKVAPPFRRATFDIIFGKGICREAEVLDIATEIDIVKKSGAWYSYDGTKIANGREKAIAALADNPELTEEIAEKVRMYVSERPEAADEIAGAEDDETNNGEVVDLESEELEIDLGTGEF